MRLGGVSTAGVGAICLFVCLGNALTLLAIWRNRSLQHKCNLLIAHLALVDLATGLVTWPVLQYLAEDGSSLLSCLAAHAIVIALKDVSQFQLLFICIVMYIKIAYPLRYRRWLSAGRMHAVSAGTWALGFTIGMTSFIWAKDGGSEPVGTCFVTIMPFPYWVGLIDWPFIAISASILIMYVRIIRIASRHLHHYGSRRRRCLAATAQRLAAAAQLPSIGATRQSVNIIESCNSVGLSPGRPPASPGAAEDVILRNEKLELSLSAEHDERIRDIEGDRILELEGVSGVAALPLHRLLVHSSSSAVDSSGGSESDTNRNNCVEFNRNDASEGRGLVYFTITISPDSNKLATNNDDDDAGLTTIVSRTDDGFSETFIKDDHTFNSKRTQPTTLGLGLSGASHYLSTDDCVICNEPAIRADTTVTSLISTDNSYSSTARKLPAAIPMQEITNYKVCLAPGAYDSRVTPLRRITDDDSSTILPQTTGGTVSSSGAGIEADLDSRYSLGSVITDGGGAGTSTGGAARRAGSSLSRSEEARRKRLQGHHNHELQLIVTMLVTYLAFVVCWLPLEFAVYCTSLGLIADASQSPFVEFSLALSLTNSGVNVVIYSWRYVAFRKAIRNLFARKAPQNSTTNATGGAVEARSGIRQVSSCRLYA